MKNNNFFRGDFSVECSSNSSLKSFDPFNLFLYKNGEENYFANGRNQVLKLNTQTKEYCIYNESDLALVTPKTKIYAEDKKDGSMASFKIYGKNSNNSESKVLYESTQNIARGRKNEYRDFNNSSQWYSLSASDKYIAFSIERNLVERVLNPDDKKGGLFIWDASSLKLIYSNSNLVSNQSFLIGDYFIIISSYKNSPIKIIDLKSKNIFEKDLNIDFSPVILQNNDSVIITDQNHEKSYVLKTNFTSFAELENTSSPIQTTENIRKKLISQGYITSSLATITYLGYWNNVDWILLNNPEFKSILYSSNDDFKKVD